VDNKAIWIFYGKFTKKGRQSGGQPPTNPDNGKCVDDLFFQSGSVIVFFINHIVVFSKTKTFNISNKQDI
jgi:hypothetical protein